MNKYNEDYSPVLALLLTQYRSVQMEKLVFGTTIRVFWFTLLLTIAFNKFHTIESTLPFLVLILCLLMISYASNLRLVRSETSVRKSLVRLDPDLEDFYIRVFNESRYERYSSHLLLRISSLVGRYEDFIWFGSSIYLLMIIFFMSP